MLGDSLTEQNNWTEKLGASFQIKNRGISGDTSDGVLARLDEILISRPSAVFLMIGTNDLWTNHPASRTVENISTIVSRIEKSAPDTRIYVQTVLPLRSEPALNAKVEAINGLVRRLYTGTAVQVIDTYAAARDSRGLLRQDYTDDGVHLTDYGYRSWEQLIVVELNRSGLKHP